MVSKGVLFEIYFLSASSRKFYGVKECYGSEGRELAGCREESEEGT